MYFGVCGWNWYRYKKGNNTVSRVNRSLHKNLHVVVNMCQPPSLVFWNTNLLRRWQILMDSRTSLKVYFQCLWISMEWIIIMDNCSIHHRSDAVGLLREVGLWFTFRHHILQTITPLKRAFSKVKTILKCMESTLHSDVVDIETCIAAAIASITPQQYVHHCKFMDNWFFIVLHLVSKFCNNFAFRKQSLWVMWIKSSFSWPTSPPICQPKLSDWGSNHCSLAGIADSAIQTLGQWHSLSYLLYIKLNPMHMANLTSTLTRWLSDWHT